MKWTEKRYRREISRMKEQIPEKEIFLSEKYQNLLRKMASQITNTRFSEVFTYQNFQGGPHAWYDGERIGINIANRITESFPEKELKNKSLIGLLGHECGHANYSDCGLRGQYLDGIMENHVLYPDFPAADCEEDEEPLKEMKEAFESGQPYLIAVFYRIAAYLQNFLEDMYIEEKMCRRYPGSIRQGILLNRERQSDLVRSVKKRKDDHAMESAIMTGLLTQFALSGSINAWDGEEDEYIDCLESCKPYLEKAVCEDGENARFFITNQIMLKMWRFIRADAERMKKAAEQEKEKQKENAEKNPEENQEKNPTQPEQKGDGKEKTGGRDYSESEKGSKGQEGKSGEEHGEGVQDAQTGTAPEAERKEGMSREEIEKIAGQVAEKLAQVLKDYSPDYQISPKKEDLSGGSAADPWETGAENQRGTETPEKDGEAMGCGMPELSGNAAGQTTEGIQKTENELGSFLYCMAKEKVDQQYEKKLQEDAQCMLRQIDFGQVHREVEEKISRSMEVPESAIEQYEEIEREVRHVMKRLQNRLLPVLEKKLSRMESGLSIGRRLDLHHVYRRDGKVFQKRQQPGEDADAVILLLVDQSASMQLLRLYYAKVTALCLYLFGKEAGIPVAVYGHHTATDYDRMKEIVCLNSFAEFDSIDGKDRYRIMGMEAHGANRDGAAVRFAGEMLLKRPEKKKFLILLSDGLPNASGYSGEVAKRDLKAVKERLEKQGVVFLAAAIGDDKENIQEIYGNAFLDISDLKKLPEKLTKEVLKRIG